MDEAFETLFSVYKFLTVADLHQMFLQFCAGQDGEGSLLLSTRVNSFIVLMKTWVPIIIDPAGRNHLLSASRWLLH